MNKTVGDLLERIEAVVGAGGLLTGDAVAERQTGNWLPEPMRALAIARPRTTDEVSAVLALCHAVGQPVVPQGGLTGLAEGQISGPHELALSTERMTDIEAVDPVGRTLRVQAGVVLQRAQQAAQEVNLLLPIDFGARGSCTIGGCIATNAGGCQVIRYGMMREQVLGVEAVLADGTVVSSMHPYLKNNTGYDLKQLFVGSEGTLGVVTRAVLRLRENPRSTQTALLALESFDDVVTVLRHLDRDLGGTLSSFELMWGSRYALQTGEYSDITPPLAVGHGFYALVEAHGFDPERDRETFQGALAEALDAGWIADALVAQSERERQTFWALREDFEPETRKFPESLYSFDVSLPLAVMNTYTRNLEAALAARFDHYDCSVFGHVGDGNIHIAIWEKGMRQKAEVEAIVYGELDAFGGSVSAEHGIGLERKAYLHHTRDPREIDLMRVIKRSLDPKGLLNPGKVLDV
jgi:FAD/FMN-containing dehydrogenase